MERMEEDAFVKRSLVDEHSHRYDIAAKIAMGRVVDCACGVGYGSKHLRRAPHVSSYLGVDPSQEAIKVARKRYARDGVAFSEGTLEGVPCPDGSVDTFVMLETLEHVVDPAVALAHVRSKLSKDGVLIGSVPSKDYELLCEEAYSPNPYHLHKFTLSDIRALLHTEFEDCKVFGAEYVLGTLLRDPTGRLASSQEGEVLMGAHQVKKVLGSYIFVAGSHASVKQAMDRLGDTPKFYAGPPKALIDLEEVRPIYQALSGTEERVRGRDELLAEQARILEERWSLVSKLESMVAERDKAIEDQGKLLEERWSLVSSLESMVAERDKAIENQGKLLEERWSLVSSLESMVAERDKAIENQGKLLEERWSLVSSLESMVAERDKAIEDQGKLLEERWSLVSSLESMVAERDKAIEDQGKLLEERWTAMLRQDALVAERDEMIARQMALLEQAKMNMQALQGRFLELQTQHDGLVRELSELRNLWSVRIGRAIRKLLQGKRSR